LGQWSWEPDPEFDLEHHVQWHALAHPGGTDELFRLCSYLHSSPLDRHRPLWEAHLIEGLADGRYAVYLKVHHAMLDGVSALRTLSRSLSTEADRRDMPAPWAPPPREPTTGDDDQPRPAPSSRALRSALGNARGIAVDAAGLAPALTRTLHRGATGRAAPLSLTAPPSMLNVPITGSRRYAARSFSIDRIRQLAKSANATVNDVVLAMCSGALRAYLRSFDALPEAPLIAMAPVSLHHDQEGGDGGNAVGAVMCNLGTHLPDPAQRLRHVQASMAQGKQTLTGMSSVQTLAMSALGMSPLLAERLLPVHQLLRPPFNVIISTVPGPRESLYWNGARLAELHPLSVPLDGQALNITATSYATEMSFGLTGCSRATPQLARLLDNLEDELAALEHAAGTW
jgi:WS/DGAT/MGAT family acyltransferase